jgi:hypothetical protein
LKEVESRGRDYRYTFRDTEDVVIIACGKDLVAASNSLHVRADSIIAESVILTFHSFTRSCQIQLDDQTGKILERLEAVVTPVDDGVAEAELATVRSPLFA